MIVVWVPGAYCYDVLRDLVKKFLTLHQPLCGLQCQIGMELTLKLIFLMGILQMGDQNVEVTEEKMDEAQISKGKAIEAMSEGKCHE